MPLITTPLAGVVVVGVVVVGVVVVGVVVVGVVVVGVVVVGVVVLGTVCIEFDGEQIHVVADYRSPSLTKVPNIRHPLTHRLVSSLAPLHLATANTSIISAPSLPHQTTLIEGYYHNWQLFVEIAVDEWRVYRTY